MPDKTRLPYRPCVGAMLLNDANEVFVGQRIDTRAEAWQMPQGGMDEGEDPRETLFRELKEEIGTAKADIIAESERWLTYDLPEELIGELWGGNYRGQKQKWYALRFTGSDNDININTEEPEFRAWRWVPPAHLPELIVSFKRPLYEQILKEFAHLL